MKRAQKTVVAAVQMVCAPELAVNVENATRLVREAAAQGARIICLPELFGGPYFCQSEDAAFFRLAEPIPGPTTEVFAALARELDVAIVVSLFEARARGLYHNTVAMVDGDRGYVGKYRKMHIPDDPAYYEKFYFTPGDLGFRNFDVQDMRIGTLICWDQWYPEAARLTAMMGAEVLFYPTAIGWHPAEKAALGAAQQQAWETMQRSHAIANGCFVVAVNRAGFEPHPGDGDGIEFWGQSFVAGPDGTLLAKADAAGEAVLVVELDFAAVTAAREGWPFFRDRRIDAYAPLTRRFLDDEAH